MVNPGEYIFCRQLLPAAAAPKDEKEDEPGNVNSKRRGSVADGPLSKGHSRSIKQQLEP